MKAHKNQLSPFCYIHFVTNKMDRYLQFSANSTAKVIFLNHLLKCKKSHIQYLGKAETNFNLKLNYRSKDLYKADANPALCHLLRKTISYRDASFVITAQICKSTLSGETKKKLTQMENFWIMKAESLKL